jgi:hypothetical protein
MSGYEQSPDYGGPEPTWRGIAVAALVIALGAAGLALLLFR